MILKEYTIFLPSHSRISGVIVSVLASSAVDRGFESRSGQIKDYKIGICCFSTKTAILSNRSKDCLRISIMCPDGVNCLLAG